LTSQVEESEVVKPAPLQLALLYKILKTQREILAWLKETTKEGIDVPLPEYTITNIKLIDLIRNYPYRPLRSIDFYNKGPDIVYYRVNEDEKEVPVENREILTCERPRATIRYVTLRVDKGKQATVKLTGHY